MCSVYSSLTMVTFLLAPSRKAGILPNVHVSPQGLANKHLLTWAKLVCASLIFGYITQEEKLGEVGIDSRIMFPYSPKSLDISDQAETPASWLPCAVPLALLFPSGLWFFCMASGCGISLLPSLNCLWSHKEGGRWPSLGLSPCDPEYKRQSTSSGQVKE